MAGKKDDKTLLKMIEREPDWQPTPEVEARSKQNMAFMQKLKEEGKLSEFFEKMDRGMTEEDLDELFALRK